MNNLASLTAGEVFPGEIPKQDQCKFDMTDSGGVIVLFYTNPSEKEVDNIKQGEMSVALTEKSGILFFLAKFGSLPWIDMPYHRQLSPNLTILPVVPEGQGYLVNVVLVDIKTGKVKALRAVGLPTRFSKTFKKLVESQNAIYENYNGVLNSIYSDYTTDNLLKLSAIKEKVR